jgi:hypothetical protein
MLPRSRRLTEEHITQTDRYSLGLEVVVQRCLSKLATDTRFLITTEGQSPVESVISVYPDGTGAECVGHLDGCVEVGGVNGCGETVRGAVANPDDIGLGLELGDCADGAEDLFLLNLHVLGDVGEDGRLDEVALVTLTLATSLDRSAALLTVLNVAKWGG